MSIRYTVSRRFTRQLATAHLVPEYAFRHAPEVFKILERVGDVADLQNACRPEGYTRYDYVDAGPLWLVRTITEYLNRRLNKLREEGVAAGKMIIIQGHHGNRQFMALAKLGGNPSEDLTVVQGANLEGPTSLVIDVVTPNVSMMEDILRQIWGLDFQLERMEIAQVSWSAKAPYDTNTGKQIEAAFWDEFLMRHAEIVE